MDAGQRRACVDQYYDAFHLERRRIGNGHVTEPVALVTPAGTAPAMPGRRCRTCADAAEPMGIFARFRVDKTGRAWHRIPDEPRNCIKNIL
jgi:hypothetical protein